MERTFEAYAQFVHCNMARNYHQKIALLNTEKRPYFHLHRCLVTHWSKFGSTLRAAYDTHTEKLNSLVVNNLYNNILSRYAMERAFEVYAQFVHCNGITTKNRFA